MEKDLEFFPGILLFLEVQSGFEGFDLQYYCRYLMTRGIGS